VRLGGRVDDHVDLGHHLLDEVGVADVAVHEREALVRHDVGEVLEVPGVRERVQRDDLVRRRVEQVADDVGRDEARPARDQHALPAHPISRSIVYSGRPSTSRWMRPRYSPIRARMKPWMPSTKRTATPPKSGPGKLERSIQYTTP